MDVFERFFTAAARQAMALANRETHRLGGNIIGDTELLLGILKQESSSGVLLLRGHGLDFANLRRELEQHPWLGRGGSTPRLLPQTQDVKVALESAIKAARELGHDRVATAHIILGMLQHPELGASRVLNAHALTFEHARCAVAELFGGKPAGTGET